MNINTIETPVTECLKNIASLKKAVIDSGYEYHVSDNQHVWCIEQRILNREPGESERLAARDYYNRLKKEIECFNGVSINESVNFWAMAIAYKITSTL